MSRKRNPYIPLFTHDIMSSAKCRRLSMRATGLYLWLLCLMNEKPQQGRWALSTNEDHPTWKNSLTYRALQNADKYARLPMFATLMARQFLPWKSGQVLKALQELYRFKLIVVEDDAIIQPRMYNDNGFKLREDTMREYLADDPNDTADDPETDLAESYREALKKDGKRGGKKVTDKGTKKDPEKVHGIHARAQLNIESESENNINNSKGNIGGVGENAQSDPTFWEFWDAYDYKMGNRSAAADQWALLSESERSIVMAAIPNYCDAHPVKKYRKTPCDFLRERIWEKTEEKTPDEQDEGQKSGFKREKDADDTITPPTVQKRADSPKNGSDGQKIPVADQPPTLREIQDYMQQRGEGGDPFRHITAEQFYDEGCMSGWTIRGGQPLYDWRARLRSLEGYRRKNGEPTVTQEGYVAYRDGKLLGTLAVRQQSVQMTGAIASHVSPSPKPGDPVAVTKPTGKKYKDKW